jgi:sRNA-binding protein
MIRLRFGMAIALTGLLTTAAVAGADVKSTEKTQMKFEGTLGRMMGLFGGKAAKDGIVNTVAVKGDRKITSNEDSATIIDLAEEKVYELNLRDKSYKVMTFAEIKKRMEDARAKAQEEANKQKARDEKKDPNQKEMELEFHVKDTGQKRQVNGFACHEVVMTIAMHEKGKTLEESGGMMMTVDSWLAPRVAGLKEITDFDVRYAKKLAENMVPSADQLAQAFAMYPGLKDAMVKMQAERVNMDGTPIESTTTVQTVQTKEQAAQAKKQEGEGGGSPAGAIGGMLGRFGKKKEDPKPAEEGGAKAAPASDTNITFMTLTNTVLSVSPAVSAEELAVPAAFKLKK